MKYYVDATGKYLGGWEAWDKPLAADRKEIAHPGIPPSAIEVPAPPEDDRQTWNGSGWSAKPAPKLGMLEQLQQRIEALERRP